MISIRYLAFDFRKGLRSGFNLAIGSLLIATVLSGCGEDSSSSASASGSGSVTQATEQDLGPAPTAPVPAAPAPSVPAPLTPAPSTPVAPAPPVNAAPSISGSPTKTSIAGNAYTFAPVAADPEGNRLSFTINNKPAWASFNTATGVLSGTPSLADIGTYKNIVIAVTDGKVQAALPAFSIDTLAGATGSTTLSWNAPTQNIDGSVLTNLGGYKIYYGTSATSMTRVVDVNNPSLTRYVVENLAPSTWYFSMTTVTSTGQESRPSSVISITVS